MDEHKPLKDRILELIEPTIKDSFLDLVEIEVDGGTTAHIRLFIDKLTGGITLDEIAKISSEIVKLLDTHEKELFKESYEIEVSSPGINRPLKKLEDFHKFTGEKVKVITREKIGNDTVFFGFIKEAVDGKLMLDLKNGNLVEIPFEKVKKANLDRDVF